MDDHHLNPWSSTHSVTDDASDAHGLDREVTSAASHISAYSFRGTEACAGGTGNDNHSTSWVQGPERAPSDAQYGDHGCSTSVPSTSSMPSTMNPAFVSRIATNPLSTTVHFQPTDTHVPATPAAVGRSVYGGVAPYATAFASSLHQAPEPQPYCAPSVRLHLARYERYWSLNPWDIAHPVTANKAFNFLDSHVLTIGHENGCYSSVVKDTIDAFDRYRRDNSHLAVYSHPQEIFIDSMGQLMSLRYDPRLQGLESLDTCFIHQEQAYKTFINMFRLYLNGAAGTSARLVVDSVRLHGVMRQRTAMLLARWLIPRIAFSFVPRLLWANLAVDMRPCVGDHGGETRREDLYLTTFIKFPRVDGGANEFMYTARRHQFAEVCPLGALGWYFFSEFHVAKHPTPDFAFYVNTPTGEILRPWQTFVLIPDDIFLHADLVHYTPAFNRGRSIKLGTTLSPNEYSIVEAESHNAGRSDLKPPTVLLKSIFPWIEQERRAYSQRLESQGAAIATDLTLCRFLDTLTWLRTVILQDAVVFYIKYPDSHIFKLPLFDCLEFRKYAKAAQASLNPTPMLAVALGGVHPTATTGPQSTQSAVERALPLPLPVVDAVFSMLGNENIDVDALKSSLTAGVTTEKVAITTQSASNVSPSKRSQAGRLVSTKNGQREKPRETRPAGSFWETLAGIDTVL
ncbi:hypothetical protein D9619_007855 [Psilocybe cf. subviscida]|uniref:Ndc10 domain-containing protein n=1 Tax=Psilocybe cf. subviscida TaxID=2480587 RepID=A0A8H5ESL9_9AGAR|nr:hypothetical protein D9619_007855 [Psilocybe cf. subviscida]